MGYITSMINGCERGITYMEKSRIPALSIETAKAYRDELTDLLSFVEDIPVQKQGPITINLGDPETVRILKKEIGELEDSCENMCEVQKNQLKKIELFEVGVINFREQFLSDKARIKELENIYKERCGEVSKLIDSNKSWNKKYNHVNEINENLLGELGELKTDNAGWQIACNKLKERNEILEEKFKLHEQTLKTRKCIGRMDK